MDIEPTLPIPISYIGGSYFLFSIDAVTYVRREHHICGVLSGTLPQIPQQNVFLGLPLKLMPEEARLLVEKGVACIVDEVKVQKDGMRALMEEDRKKYLRELESQGQHAMRLQHDRKEQQREKALKKIEEKKAAKAKKSAEKQQQEEQPDPVNNEAAAAREPVVDLFAHDQQSSRRSSSATAAAAPFGTAMGVTPATSYPPLPYEWSAEQKLPLPDVPSSYPLFAHLHSEGYYLSPGLRFGCQYLAYPGDPLRFHSHFLSVSAEWDEELDLMSIVAGGRLGTGVKKGFMIGGAEKKLEGSDAGSPSSVRTFSIEWGGM
ncbi:tRNA-splicing endonuclease subunit Sen34 [Aspergillus costaricaensis CBS 115574]|uniref:tRNA-splicing endonuclease subunit Sen34 n=1 Tax=Aspergillus costaricaensis CBS 115574 TaxID=1448317 RepID=A0ACD1ITD3_9EURO|nr:tRNA-splicing endonuclease subunit Sen34 [Aspergillus costaricaensis CBS 115574]RAK93867.1 tRNA-splicing endonuclease subunit Sen34 [Aspergillus costaricaensis CBS 115574]